MTNWLQKMKESFTNKQFVLSMCIGWVFLFAAMVISYYAGLYATERASNSVTDIILSNIRVFDVDGIFIYGPLIFWIFTILVVLAKPERFPFVLKSISLFVLVRSLFITLTHIGPFPTQMIPDSLSSDVVKTFFFGSDLFFSGHTGLPFLMALVFWDNVWLRWFFIASSLLFGAVVLLGHMHYSIDVLSAFFITYTIFHIARTVFKKDYEHFLN